MKKFSSNTNTPANPSEISLEWLKKALNAKDSNEVVSFEIDKNFGPWSLLGKAIRIELKWATPNSEPRSVIVKFQVSASEPKREGEIYELLSSAKAPYIPHIFSEFGNGNLIMEDLSSTHSVLKDDLTVTQIENVISDLADIQNRYFGDSRIPKYDLSHFMNMIKINMQSWDIFEKRYKEQLGDYAYDFEWISKNPEVVSSHYNSNPGSLSHGDVNKSNLLFKNDGSDKPIFIDWQLSAQRVLPFDLSYFLVKQLTVEQRRKHEDEFLNRYHGLLREEIKIDYPFDRLVLDYRACLTRSMLSAVMRVGPRFESQPNRLELADILANRVIEAVKDLKPIEAIRELKAKGRF